MCTCQPKLWKQTDDSVLPLNENDKSFLKKAITHQKEIEGDMKDPEK